MLSYLLIAGLITLPYWLIQRLRGHTTPRHKHRRSRVFITVIGAFCAFELGLAGFSLSQIPADQADEGGRLGRQVALPILILIYLYRPNGGGWKALAPYKAPSVEA